MSAEEVLTYMRRAKHSSSPDNQIDSIIKALEKTGQALRELEAKVSKLENRG